MTELAKFNPHTVTEEKIVRGDFSSHGGNGNPPNDGGMDPRYATREEYHQLDKSIAILSAQINSLPTTESLRHDLTTTIDPVLSKMNADEIQLGKLQSREDGIATLLWWLMGIVSAGMVIPLVTLAFKAIFK